LRAVGPGETLRWAANAEIANLDVVHTICDILGRTRSGSPIRGSHHVRRGPARPRPPYAIDSAKIRRELGWTPAETFRTGMRRTIAWYLANGAWLAAVTSGEYQKWISLNYARAPA
jgi:dTDP-glucose 4,6-dehydratase